MDAVQGRLLIELSHLQNHEPHNNIVMIYSMQVWIWPQMITPSTVPYDLMNWSSELWAWDLVADLITRTIFLQLAVEAIMWCSSSSSRSTEMLRLEAWMRWWNIWVFIYKNGENRQICIENNTNNDVSASPDACMGPSRTPTLRSGVLKICV